MDITEIFKEHVKNIGGYDDCLPTADELKRNINNAVAGA